MREKIILFMSLGGMIGMLALGAYFVYFESLPMLMKYGVFAYAAILGLISFYAPCAFPLLPAYVTLYFRMKDSESIKSPFFAGLAGFTGIFIVTIILSVIVISTQYAIRPYLNIFQPFLAMILIALGIILLFTIPIQFPSMGNILKNFSLRASNIKKIFLFGVGYALAAAPCSVILLVALIILLLAIGSPLITLAALIIFAIAHSIMFILLTISVWKSKTILQPKILKYHREINKAIGIVTMLIGIYIMYTFVFVPVPM